MKLKKLSKFAGLLAVALVAFLVQLSPPKHAAAGRAGGLEPGAYLPFVSHNVDYGIYGTVTYLANPIQSVVLELRFYNGSTWSTKATTTTDAAGEYHFLGMPSLQPGQRYYVRYSNPGTSAYLSEWHTAVLLTYTGGSVLIGDFDLANIKLIAPASQAVVSLPRQFNWSLRTLSPTDNYEFNLYDPNDLSTWFYTNPPVGYVNNYVLQSMPSGFSTGTWYLWFMWVYDDLGGFGVSYWANWVKFAGSMTEMIPVPADQVLKSADINLDLDRLPALQEKP